MSSIKGLEDPSWRIAERWQQYEGELRTNILRMGSITLFYIIHLLRYLSAQGGEFGRVLQLEQAGKVTPEFHVKVTLLVAAWTGLAGAIHFSLAQRVFPRWLPVASTCLDLTMLTCVLMVSNGPRSPLVSAYFLVLVLAALRFNLPLVRLATVGAVVGYVCLLGLARWPDTFGQPGLNISVPRYHQLVMVAALLTTGVLLGQVVRRVREIAADYAQRVESTDRASNAGDSCEAQ